MVRIVASFIVLSLSLPGAYGQSPSPPHSQFELASVKPHLASDVPAQTSISRDPGRVTYLNVTLRGLIREAYGMKVYPLSHGPDALSTDRYDVIAKAPAGASKRGDCADAAVSPGGKI